MLRLLALLGVFGLALYNFEIFQIALAIYVIGFVVLFFSVWLLFIIIMWAKHNEESIPKYARFVFYFLFVVGLFLDVLLNIWMTPIFQEMPTFRDSHYKWLPTLSERLRDIRSGKSSIPHGSWRWRLARFLCCKIIEPHDPGHCGGSWD